jgi:hypothetical protein
VDLRQFVAAAAERCSQEVRREIEEFMDGEPCKQ